jgi:hypothetical protein
MWLSPIARDQSLTAIAFGNLLSETEPGAVPPRKHDIVGLGEQLQAGSEPTEIPN